jgi:exopolysaccharide production protein ExoZ
MPILSIQYLRAVAAMMVVFYHIKPQLARMGYTGAWWEWLDSGVDVFFVISGFIMWTTAGDGKSTPRAFVLRRLHRIVPLYWVITSFSVAIMVVAPQLVQVSRFDMHHVVASYLFIPALHPTLKMLWPVVTPGWTINYEMFFYAIFAGCMLVKGRAQAYALSLVFVGLVCLQIFVHDGKSVPAFYTSSIILEFLAGVWVAILVQNKVLLGARALPCALAFVVMVVVLRRLGDQFALPDVVMRGAPAVVLVYGCVAAEMRRPVREMRLFRHLGDASYSIYLSHFSVLSAFAQAWRALHLHQHNGGWIGFAVVAPGVVMVAGLACYHFVELPLGQVTRRLMVGTPRA